MISRFATDIHPHYGCAAGSATSVVVLGHHLPSEHLPSPNRRIDAELRRVLGTPGDASLVRFLSDAFSIHNLEDNTMTLGSQRLGRWALLQSPQQINFQDIQELKLIQENAHCV